MKDYSATDFVRLIDANFEEHVGSINRVDIKWGIWSREMNLVLKTNMNEEGKDTLLFGLVFSYWIIISQLLDLVYKSSGLRGIIRGKKIREKTEEAIDLRERILTEDAGT